VKRVLAVVLAGGEGERLSILSGLRAKPAVPFGGKYRIIDFALSNCVNSDIDNVVVLTQYNPRSMNDHIGAGRPWDLDRSTGGIRLLQPFVSRGRPNEWYRGTADAVLRNIDVIRHAPGDTVLVLAGDHIYKMDYQPFVQAHRRHRADVTIAVRSVPLEDASRFGILALDDAGRVVEWQEKPKLPRSNLASMGIYVFSKRAILRWLDEARIDFGHHVIPAMIEGGARVFGYRFDGYWQDVGTIESYWQANMDLLDERPELDLYDRDWLIHTRSEERAPAKIGPTASVHRSMISHGCVIYGTVERSVLSPGVRVDVGAVVRDSIVMFDSVIRAGAIVDRAILDKEVSVGPNAVVGEGMDFDLPNRQEPGRLNTGITVVGKRAIVPRGIRIGRNCKIAGGVRTGDYRSRVVRSGQSVEARSPREPDQEQAQSRVASRPAAPIAMGPGSPTPLHASPAVVRAGDGNGGIAEDGHARAAGNAFDPSQGTRRRTQPHH
jgi:glucose-1-phosphate adenylyltransferase